MHSEATSYSELARRFPAVATAFPRVVLGNWPTPVTRLTRLGAELGVRSLWAKREDLSSAVYGGNKVRKLEFSLGAAASAGAREIITFGAAGSNHALATAMLGARLGMHVTTFMTPQPPSHHVRANLLTHTVIGASVEHCRDAAEAARSATTYAERVTDRTGAQPFVIPLGGTDAMTTIGGVDAGLEFAAQVAAGAAERPDVVYVPFGSMGTAVGVTLGMAAGGLLPEVRAVRVVPETIGSAPGANRLTEAVLSLLADTLPGFPLEDAHRGRLTVVDGFFGDGYGVFSREGIHVMRLMLEAEGLTLEGTYTAKTVAALVADAASGELEGRSVVYWHTFSSVDVGPLSAGVDYRALPEAFHDYFEQPLQPLDREDGV